METKLDRQILSHRIYLGIFDQTHQLHDAWRNRVDRTNGFEIARRVAHQFMQSPEFAGICKGFTVAQIMDVAEICREMADACVFSVISL